MSETDVNRDCDPPVGEAYGPLSRRAFLTRAGATGLAFTVVPTVLAACGSSTGQASSSSGIGGTIDYFGFEGVDLSSVNGAYIAKNNLKITKQAMGGENDAIPKLKGGSGAGIDLIGFTNDAVPAYVEAQILNPIDESKLPLLDTILPQLFRGPGGRIDGKLYALPIVWAAFGLSRNPKKIPKPFTSWLDVLDPSLKGRVGAYNDPISFMWPVAKSLGYKQGQVPKDKLGETKEFAEKLIGQTRGLAAGYGDLVSRLAAGEADVAWPGYTQYNHFVPEGGGPEFVTDLTALKEGPINFCEVMGFPVTSDNVDSTYAYVNSLLVPKVNAAGADYLGSSSAVKGGAKYQKSEIQKIYLNDPVRLLNETETNTNFPHESDQFVTAEEWYEVFAEVTA